MSFTLQNARKARYNASDVWTIYHNAQMTAFRECFKGMPYGCWKRDQVLEELKLICPQLLRAQKTNVIKNLRSAIKFRKVMLQKFPYDTEEATTRHRDSILLLKQMMFLLREEPINEESLDLETADIDEDGHFNKSYSGSEGAAVCQKKEAQDTVDDDTLHTFVQSISASVEEICSSWGRATKDLDISCATAGK